jgi:hypothetical protein
VLPASRQPSSHGTKVLLSKQARHMRTLSTAVPNSRGSLPQEEQAGNAPHRAAAVVAASRARACAALVPAAGRAAIAQPPRAAARARRQRIGRCARMQPHSSPPFWVNTLSRTQARVQAPWTGSLMHAFHVPHGARERQASYRPL